MKTNWKLRIKPIGKLCVAGMLTASVWLLSGCGGRVAKRPELPMAFHFMEPGSTNTVVVPANCAYGVWTTDRGLLYLQGLTPKD